MSFSTDCRIIEFQNRKQKEIYHNVHKKQEIEKQIAALQDEIRFLNYDIDDCRYAIRKRIGRE